MGRIASFHLDREPSWKTPMVLGHLGADRLLLPRVPGLAFWRLLGTGNGDDTGARRRPRTQRPVRGLGGRARSRHVPRRPPHPAVAGIAPRRAGTCDSARSAGTEPGGHRPARRTRRGNRRWPGGDHHAADVRRRSWRAFGAASGVVDAELHSAPGLIDVVGIGETPVGRLGHVQPVGVAMAQPGASPTRCPIIET